MKEKVEVLDGGWGTIQDIKDPHIDSVAKFAVSEFNKQSNSELKFQSVVSGDFQIVCGINYRLVLDVYDRDNSGCKTYEAEVYQGICRGSRTLTYFKSVS